MRSNDRVVRRGARVAGGPQPYGGPKQMMIDLGEHPFKAVNDR
jgi:hypothetical protein